jgi:hypothetical protein
MQRTVGSSRLPPNNSFKPNLLRCSFGVADKACHTKASTTQVGLIQALGRTRALQRWPSRSVLLAARSSVLFFGHAVAARLGFTALASGLRSHPSACRATIACLSGGFGESAGDRSRPRVRAGLASATSRTCGAGNLVACCGLTIHSSRTCFVAALVWQIKLATPKPPLRKSA